MHKDSIYVTAESLKIHVPSMDLNTIIEKIEDQGWRVSDCLRFSDFTLNLIKVNVAWMLAPENSLLKQALNQLMSSRCVLDRKSRVPDICLLSLRRNADNFEVGDQNDAETENTVEDENFLE